MTSTRDVRIVHEDGDPYSYAHVADLPFFGGDEDADLIANAPADIVWLLARVDELELELQRRLAWQQRQAEQATSADRVRAALATLGWPS